MSVPPEDQEYEVARLATVILEIQKQLTGRREETTRYKDLLTGARKSEWEESPHEVWDFDALVEAAAGMDRLKAAAKHYRFSAGRGKQLERLARSPYFARIDFRESGESGIRGIYIGIAALTDADTGKHLVYDWRAPVSSMYYDFELGAAQFAAPSGIVSGDILLKRHFRIKDGRLEFMFDNSLTIYDEVLQETLEGATGDRMRSIVNTIQREQNRVIRGESSGALVVQGSAGSGKTAIALHRAAYLLYKHRSTMSARNILMFSPGRLFVDYTSPVLPELGEEPVRQVCFGDFGAEQLAKARSPEPDLASLRVESMDEQLEYLLEHRGTPGHDVRVAGIRLKSTTHFAELIERYAEHLAVDIEDLDDVVFRGKVIMSKEEAADLLRCQYAYLPLEKRVDKIRRRVFWLLEEVQQRRAEEIERELLDDPESAYLFRKEIRRMSRIGAHQEIQLVRDKVRSWGTVSAYAAYRRLFEGEELSRSPARPDAPEFLSGACAETVERLSSSTIPYEDLAPLLLLRGLLEGFPEQSEIKHVIVDEVQDYSPVQHEVLRRSFPQASFTLLGDVNQSLSAHAGSSTYDEVLRQVTKVYGANGEPVVPVRLTESYRSTREITEFTRAILAGGEPIQAIERPGELPRVMRSSGRQELGRAIARDVAALCEEGLGSIAVICKTARESWAAYDDIKSLKDLLKDRKPHLVKASEHGFRRGILVIPSYLAKGLEFETVLIYNASQEDYSYPEERHVLYAACTRALHRLHLHYAGELSPFIEAVDPVLYERRG
jgi:DNA helicase-2/ATP-dependent DNA helicase PcrA